MDINKQEILNSALQVRYIKLHMKIQLLEDTILPKNKVSALRGGIGEMLLRVNCIRDRNCDLCDFRTECIVQRTMYSQFEIKPNFVTKGDSVGYVYECTNYQEQFYAGEQMEFNLLLFGKTIVYFNQYMQAIYALGQQGIGKYNSKFIVVEVKNSKLQPILKGNALYMANYEIQTVEDYVRYRKKQLQERGCQYKLVFDTPLTLKYQGEFIQQFHFLALFSSIKRRIYMLNCFEGIETTIQEMEVEELDIVSQEHKLQGVERYSSRQGGKMMLRGIVGSLEVETWGEEELGLLLAGELLHIGKNTSFGFGHYRVI